MIDCIFRKPTSVDVEVEETCCGGVQKKQTADWCVEFGRLTTDRMCRICHRRTPSAAPKPTPPLAGQGAGGPTA